MFWWGLTGGFLVFLLGWLMGWSMQRAVVYAELWGKQGGAKEEIGHVRRQLEILNATMAQLLEPKGRH